jgi:nucleotide-binding universal stress UspA family protein
MALPPGHILACTDFSEASEAAARRAAILARERGSRLSLLAVLPASPLRDAADLVADRYFPKDDPRFDPKRIEQQLDERVRAQAERLEKEEGARCDPMVRVGRPAAEIAAAAREHEADLIVVGQHGSHALKTAIIGTTAQKLLRLAPCAVLVVKRPPPYQYATVLLPTDLSAESADAMRQSEALVPAATFHVAHAFELPYGGLMNYASVGDAALSHYSKEEEKRLEPELRQFAEQVGFASQRVTLHLEHGYPSRQIDEWLARLKPDLIALAAHGKGEIQRLFLGSVSLHVVLSAPCDVLLVRRDETQ